MSRHCELFASPKLGWASMDCLRKVARTRAAAERPIMFIVCFYQTGTCLPRLSSNSANRAQTRL